MRRFFRLIPCLPATLVAGWILGAGVGGFAAEGDLPGDEPRRDRGGWYDRPLPLYFPPTPPPLDWPLFRIVVPVGRLPPPAELAPHVAEIFYPGLGTRLATGTLSKQQQDKLAKYRATKLALQRELRAACDAQATAALAERRQALEALARRQAPQLAELEKTAEELRRDLITSNTDWSARRDWHLTDKERRAFSPREIAVVMRGYAFYHDDLALEQRQLLREISMELAAAVEKVEEAGAQPFIFFSPAPARVMLPDFLPPELMAKVAAYQAKKSQLKKALYDTTYARDGALLGFWRQSFKALAARQAATYREVEDLAEEIRRGLAELPAPAPPPETSPLPPTLALRVMEAVRENSVARRDAISKAEAILARGRNVDAHNRLVYRFAEDGMSVSRLPQRNPRQIVSPEEDAMLGRLQAQLEAVAAEYGRQLATILTEQEAIRAEAAAALGESRRDKVEAALIAASRLATVKQHEDAYRDYRLAAFEPGLSPEQRRLLFDRAVEHLDLPLPRGEYQATRRAPSW